MKRLDFLNGVDLTALDGKALSNILNSTAYNRAVSPVYFIRCDKYVKIGYSGSPQTRLKQIKKGISGSLVPQYLKVEAATLVATEPGGFGRERELHARFAHLRHTGEWFTEAPELTEYIESLSERNAA